MTTKEKRMSAIFNEWVKRYAENPEEFCEILDEEGKPFEDYGDNAAAYFLKIEKEMDEQSLLPND
jgi:hypothetical protein